MPDKNHPAETILIVEEEPILAEDIRAKLTGLATGLGLPIVLGIVQAHGGETEMDNAPHRDQGVPAGKAPWENCFR